MKKNLLYFITLCSIFMLNLSVVTPSASITNPMSEETSIMPLDELEEIPHKYT